MISVTVAPFPSRITIVGEGRRLGAHTFINDELAWVYEDSPPFDVTFVAYATEETEVLGALATFTISVPTPWETLGVTMVPNPVTITIEADKNPATKIATARLTFESNFNISGDRTFIFDSNIDFPALKQKLTTGRMQIVARDDITVIRGVQTSFSGQKRFLEGDKIDFTIKFSGSFRSTEAGILQFYLDDEPHEATCGENYSDPALFSSNTISELDCDYVVKAGDFADMISIPVQGNLFPENAVLTYYFSGDPATVNSAITTEQMWPQQVRGGVNYIELLTDRKSLQEGVGATGVKVQATILQGYLPTHDIEIPLVLTDGTTTPADYTVSGTQTITIPATQSSGSATLLITPVEDYVKEDTETIRVEGGMSPYWVEGADLNIIDAPSIVLSVNSMSITEGGDAQAVVVTAALGDPSDQVRPRPIPVTLSLFGSAGGGDYTVAEPLIVTIPANTRSASKTLTFTPMDDLLLEGDETIVLRGTTPGLTVEGTELVLEDNDEVPEVELMIDDNTIAENDDATRVMVTAKLDPSVIVDNNTIITLNLMGSAIQGSNGDYTATWNPSHKMITVPALSNVGTASVTLTLTPYDDDIAEGDETIVVEGMAVVENTGDQRIVRVKTITLKDDDLPGVVIDPTALAVPEKGSNTYTVVLTTKPTGNVRVAMIAVLSATDVSVDNEVLTFTPDNWNQAQDDDSACGPGRGCDHRRSGDADAHGEWRGLRRCGGG